MNVLLKDMDKIIRKGVAFEPDQLKAFDKLTKNRGYNNRSESIRDLIRTAIVEDKVQDKESKMIGTLTIIYNHHDGYVQHNLTHLQHHIPNIIKSTLHIHIDEKNCLEVIVLKGKVKFIKKLADKIIATKGVKHGKLVMVDIINLD